MDYIPAPNLRQRLFIEQYLSNGYNASKAYKHVYQCDTSTAYNNSSELLKKPYIQLYIKELTQHSMDAKGLTKDWILDKIISETEGKRASDRLKALELLGRSKDIQLFKDQQDINLRAIPAAKSTAELDAEYISLIQQQDNKVIDSTITPASLCETNHINNDTIQNDEGEGESESDRESST